MNKEQFLKSLPFCKVINKGTKAYNNIVLDYKYAVSRGIIDILQAYKTCSDAKVQSFNDIWFRARQQGALNVYICGHNCMAYSTIYSVTLDDETETIVKDTKDNIYVIFE